MGISAQGIISTSNLLEVKDPFECLFKLKELVAEIRTIEDQNKDKDKGNMTDGNYDGGISSRFKSRHS